MMRISVLIALAALGGCSTAPGTGWSRASDLSVYGSMQVFQRAALDEERLCAGLTPDWARDHWRREYGARHDAVTAALEQRYGAPALASARQTWAPRVACGDVPDAQWRWRYARLLRLLEIRLQLAGEEEG